MISLKILENVYISNNTVNLNNLIMKYIFIGENRCFNQK